MNETVLIVEDDHELRSGLRDNLEFEGYRVEDAWNFTEAAEIWRNTKPSLVILDLMLPGRSGFQLLNEMRSGGRDTPVIILSARGELWDKVKGFRLGCDDYMVKPFSIIELLVRLKALLKRSGQADQPAELIGYAGLQLDIQNRMLTINDAKIELAAKEFQLLHYFLTNPGRVIPRKELLSNVWNSPPQVVTRTVDVYVSNLRQKLTASECEIQTVYKVGYRMTETE